MIKMLLLSCLCGLSACSSSDRSVAEDPVDAEVAALNGRGYSLFFGRAGCVACHSIDAHGGRIIGPNLGVSDESKRPIAARTEMHRPTMRPIEYLVESIVAPDAVVVKGYARGVMLRADRPPVALTDEQVIAVATYLAGYGDVPKVTPDDVAAARSWLRVMRSNEAQ